jgi:ankyrin repeat protein
VVNLLLERGANIEATDQNVNDVLLLEAAQGKIEFVKLLLEKGANIEATGPLRLEKGANA